MIRHICMFKLKDENKEANLKEALRRLEEMREIPLIATFEVVTNAAAAPDSNYDLSLIFDFKNMDDLNAYQKHLSLIHISEPTRQAEISYAVFCLKKKNEK